VQRGIHDLCTSRALDLLDHRRRNVALSEQPDSTAAPRNADREPMLPIPSTRDTTRARMADHIASPCCQRSSYKLPRRCDSHQERERAHCLDFSTVDSYATNFRASFVGHSALTQADLEEKIGLAGGDIFHAALEPDQSWAAWPMLGCGDCPAAVKGPDSCGAGAHRATRHRHAGPQRSARNGA
jgi:phytoene dehydrogenase-like protein